MRKGSGYIKISMAEYYDKLSRYCNKNCKICRRNNIHYFGTKTYIGKCPRNHNRLMGKPHDLVANLERSLESHQINTSSIASLYSIASHYAELIIILKKTVSLPGTAPLCYNGWGGSASEFLHLRKFQSNLNL